MHIHILGRISKSPMQNEWKTPHILNYDRFISFEIRFILRPQQLQRRRRRRQKKLSVYNIFPIDFSNKLFERSLKDCLKYAYFEYENTHIIIIEMNFIREMPIKKIWFDFIAVHFVFSLAVSLLRPFFLFASEFFWGTQSICLFLTVLFFISLDCLHPLFHSLLLFYL